MVNFLASTFQVLRAQKGMNASYVNDKLLRFYDDVIYSLVLPVALLFLFLKETSTAFTFSTALLIL